VVSVIASGPRGRRFKPGRGDTFFKGDKNPQHTFFRVGSKTGGTIIRFYCLLKRSLLSVNEMLTGYNSHSFSPFLLPAPR
jgi:hypothetical protein